MTETEPKKKPLNPDKFTWQQGDIVIIKQGGKDIKAPPPVKPKAKK